MMSLFRSNRVGTAGTTGRSFKDSRSEMAAETSEEVQTGNKRTISEYAKQRHAC